MSDCSTPVSVDVQTKNGRFGKFSDMDVKESTDKNLISQELLDINANSPTPNTYFKPISQQKLSLKDLQRNTNIHNSQPRSTLQENEPALLMAGVGNASVQAGVSSLREGRAREKRDLKELNEKFSNYIEKARFLEAQNKALLTEIDILKRTNIPDNKKIKEMYEVEMSQLRNLLMDSEKSKVSFEIQIKSLNNEMDVMRKRLKLFEENIAQNKSKLERQYLEMGNLEREVIDLRKYKSTNEDDIFRRKEETNILRDEIKKLRQNLDSETLAYIINEYELQNSRETLEFERQIHEEELKDLSNVLHRNKTNENMSHWQSEMDRALRDIQIEYDSKLIGAKQEMEDTYALQMQEIRASKLKNNIETSRYREENIRVRSQIKDMKSRISVLELENFEYRLKLNKIQDEHEKTQRSLELQVANLKEQFANSQNELKTALFELQSLSDLKLGLEMEISAYSKLLELEEKRNTDTESTLSPRFTRLSNSDNEGVGESTFASEFDSDSISRSTSINIGGKSNGTTERPTHDPQSKRVKCRRTTKGNVSIAECDINGSFIVLENIGKKVEILDGMDLRRHIDGDRDAVIYAFPSGINLNAGETIHICAKGKRTGKGIELELNISSWCTGNNIVTTLTDKEGKEKAVHYQEVSGL